MKDRARTLDHVRRPGSPPPADEPERVDTLVVGGGQAGLSVGYHLKRRGGSFLIVDGHERVGDAWRQRWDSLRLFTPARFSGLNGMPFPAPAWHFPTKDEMGDYLEAYAERFELPVRTGTRVERLSRGSGDVGVRFVARAGGRRIEARHVVVAMAGFQEGWTPPFASELDDGILRMHSTDYRRPSQLREGPLLLVGAGNTASEIAMELARTGRHDPLWMAGRDTGSLPFDIHGPVARLGAVRMVLRVAYHRVLTRRWPWGRAMRRKVLHKGGPLIRVHPRDLERAGVERTPRVEGVEDGLPVLEDGRVLEPANVIWCTGYRAGFDWIDLDLATDDHGEPLHRSGVVDDVPGLYFVGLHFLHAMSSDMVHGVGRDAERVAEAICPDGSRTSASPDSGLAVSRSAA